MEGRIWSRMVALLPASAERRGRFTFDARTILMVVLWAILHDRPMNWAARAENWPRDQRPPRLPSPSTLSRRWRTAEIQTAAENFFRRSVAEVGLVSPYAVVDAKPLPVGGGSEDADARPGRAVGHLAKGHKLFALVTASWAIAEFDVGAMADAETTRARGLLARAPQRLTRILGDGVYDSVPLHRVAATHGRRLYTPLRQNRVGRRQQPERVHLLRVLRTTVGQRLIASRDEVERAFGLLGNFHCGFKGLPNWARRTHRVHRWMWGKIVTYHLYLAEKPHTRRAAL